MSSTLRERTVPPLDNPADLVRFARGRADAEAPARAKLVGPDESQVDIPADLYELLRDVVGALSQGMAISIAPHNTMLTTRKPLTCSTSRVPRWSVCSPTARFRTACAAK